MKRLLVAAVLASLIAVPAVAQGRSHKKEFVVAPTRAMSITRAVLVQQGFEIVRIDKKGNDQVVWYRRGNMGNGKGHGRPVKLVIRQVHERVVFIDTPDAVLVDINVRMRL